MNLVQKLIASALVAAATLGMGGCQEKAAELVAPAEVSAEVRAKITALAATGLEMTSWMCACLNAKDYPFSANDITALKYLYK